MSSVATNWVGQKLGSTPYHATRLLGMGGMALVYLAEDLHTGKKVVVKTPRLDVCDPNLLARFREETRAARLLQHPHIVPLLDAAEHEDTPFLVLPYLEGGTLLERIQSGQHASMSLARIFHRSDES